MGVNKKHLWLNGNAAMVRDRPGGSGPPAGAVSLKTSFKPNLSYPVILNAGKYLEFLNARDHSRRTG